MSIVYTNLLDEGAELYKCDRLLDVVSLQDTLVASPIATSIQPPHVRFQVLYLYHIMIVFKLTTFLCLTIYINTSYTSYALMKGKT